MNKSSEQVDFERLYYLTRMALLMDADEREFFMLELIRRSTERSIEEAFQATRDREVTR